MEIPAVEAVCPSNPAGYPENKLLRSLPSDDYRRLQPQFRTIRLHTSQLLQKQGATVTEVFFPVAGACSLIKVMQDGLTAEIASVGNEGVIGSGVFCGDEESPGNIVAKGALVGQTLSVSTFMEEMRRHEAFYERVLRYSQVMTTQVMQTTACNGLHSVEQRCCRWLLITRDHIGGRCLTLTQEFMATMLGVRRPTVTLIVQSLDRAGIVRAGRGELEILDDRALEARSCECYRALTTTLRRLLPELRNVQLAG